MPAFEISVAGSNLVLRHSPRRIAFHATLFLEAESPEAAGADAVARVLSDPNIDSVRANPPGDPPQVEVDECVELSPRREGAPLPGPIFCFF